MLNRINRLLQYTRDGLAYGEIGRFPGGPIGRWAGELLTLPTQNLSNTISELGPHLYHVNTVERSKIWRFLVSAPNIIEFCIKNKSVFSKVGRFNNIFPGRIFEPVRPCNTPSLIRTLVIRSLANPDENEIFVVKYDIYYNVNITIKNIDSKLPL